MTPEAVDASEVTAEPPSAAEPTKPLHTLGILEKVEWDTLMFFYGIILGVGGLGTLGYLALMSRAFYKDSGRPRRTCSSACSPRS